MSVLGREEGYTAKYGLGNTLVQGGNTGTVNYQYITIRNDIMGWIQGDLRVHRGYHINKPIQDGGDMDAPLCPNRLREAFK